jgi:hypothetical protein
MQIKHHIVQATTALATVAVSGVLSASAVIAAGPSFNPGVSVFDDFNERGTLMSPHEDGYWWIDGQGVDKDGNALRVRDNQACKLQTCVRIVQDSSVNDFVRLEGSPTTTTHYVNANLADKVDGADTDPEYSGQTYPGDWNPSVGHPVTVEARVRFGENFNMDGTGGANGTTGIWLWSNPFSIGAANQHGAHDGIGFSWASADSEFAQGLTMTVVKGEFPVFLQPVTANININDWNTYKFVWSEDIVGNQSVSFYINGQHQGDAQMFAGATTVHNMGFEFWLDNLAFKPSQYPNFLQNIPITEERHIDLDQVSINKN